MRSHPPWRILPVLLLMLALVVPAFPTFAQDAGAILSIDTPMDAGTSELGQNLVFTGWAAREGGPGTGIDHVMVLDAPMASGGVVVAEARYGMPRADVAAAYGAAFTNSEFAATWMAAGSAGNRTFWVYAHSPSNDGWTNKTVTVRLGQAMGAQPPAAPMASPNTPYVTDQFGGQMGPPPGMPFGNQYGNQFDQYGNQYSNQSGNQFGPLDQFGNPIGAANCAFNPYGSANFGSYSGITSGPGAYGCPSGYGTGLGIPGTTVFATAGTDGTVALTWMPVPNATQYRVYQMSPSTSLISTVNQQMGVLSVVTTLSGLTPGSQHTYQVRAVVSGGSEAAVVASWIGIGIGIAPGVAVGVAPVIVTVGASTASSVALTWIPSVSSGVTSYQTSQSLSAAGPFVPSVLSGPSMSGATVGSLLPNTTYYFQVTAMAGSAASTPSVVVSAITTL